MYSKKVLEHFQNPHNQGKMDDASAVGEDGSQACGDVVKFYLKVKNNIITDVMFETLGCAAAIASSSALTDMVKGKTIDEALKITKNQLIDELGGLPAPKLHCSVLGVDALHKAIENYKDQR
ncbi:iron-sulfur cluster assembly scaffold protein [Candidatus Falkowbacteria bacterium RIFOXYB2_FULL_34_18]|uniref:Iron-sulfur cluster assembly scaffold protein n=1 Tax=Candidatus Falkowbacteria bacterium RIFOXYD2_FULL_34_120 TaxID=1798007 RepID=A0A1F5TRU8_9BACT|nr:MAG: iron-sulfur cluster assembly scaffold protein [Candidatus Falkowbacteria bacterium RIFOXYB2_FULL_34_18]OGF29703.1 MAG: iron-sulfur cluster assembly scaffold protein [Candidatus Falkowbacteria bacterium RIFOXYC12_FULL_34_55]OGF37432.1 MAG: iron-sulfur cluster assembly scaffold protein [Candidatus Falkowbacteria bacterium RIFOXYC2_FULL_34_220]OGF39157.1 MAG: iron-sulfur cluster assembly scaffold protein [Candidatus Falkowbacteria bacterium RIFOXYD12_FULL_34_57]OGF41706.1 MAG: iron-sulfur 